MLARQDVLELMPDLRKLAVQPGDGHGKKALQSNAVYVIIYVQYTDVTHKYMLAVL